MSRELTPRSTLDNLKKEAKRWLRAVRANVREARERLERALPDAPALPTLRDIQHALAREHGLPGWTALKGRLAGRATADQGHAGHVDWFLENACPDHHVRGARAHLRARHTALRILTRYPDVAHDGLATAVVCGDRAAVERILAERPAAASEKRLASGPDRSGVGGHADLDKDLGPKLWEPLLFLCFTRLPLAAVEENAVAIARILLDHGADPNAFFMAGDSRYTPLVGAIGEGEEDRPPHPQRDALARLLLERGAEPYDTQVLYDIHFHGNVLWFLELMHEHSVRRGRAGDWADPNWSMLDMGGYGCGARWHLELAIKHDDVALAEWALAHGANPNAPPASDPRFSRRTLYEEAVRHGCARIAELLQRHGATPSAVTLTGEETFAAAAFRLDQPAAETMLAEHPEYLHSTMALFAAAKRDRVDVVQFLLDLGLSPDVENSRQERALHMAAYGNALRVADLLIERGAEIDPVESNWQNTPLGAAACAQHAPMIELLGRHSRDIWELTYAGNVDRLRDVLSEETERARIVTGGHTPLMWLPPDDEVRALAVARLLLVHGADPSVKNKEGQTAADRAERLGMFELAELLRAAVAPPARLTLKHYESLAEDFLTAYRTGEAGAMKRVWAAAGHMRSWDGMRRYVQLDLGKRPVNEGEDVELTLEDTRLLVARGHGFETWQALEEYVATVPAKSTMAARPVTLLSMDDAGKTQRAGTARDWDEVIARMKEKHIPGLDAQGQMTDEVLERISRLEHVTSLDLASSAKVTDAGLRSLARMPQLRHLDLTGCRISDEGLAVLRHLPELRAFKLVHHAGVSDAGLANLGPCAHLERVDLMGTATGDGVIRTLTGKPRLGHFLVGSLVTDAGLALFREFPVYRNWRGGEVSQAITSPEAGPSFLWLNLRSPVTDRGLAHLSGLDGLFALSLFGIPGMPSFEDERSGITASGLKHLADLPHLEWLGCTSRLCTDEAMAIIGTMPRVRMLMCQDAVAGDVGFTALSRSRTIESIWGRDCDNLGGRGFEALAAMPALRSLAVSCRNVDDAGLSALPRFSALTELTPMGMRDDGFRHVGRSERLESLILMYCRDTTDVATEHLAGLPNLKKYFASYTRITDRSLEILASMRSLESIELYGCPGVTDAGVAALAIAPSLSEVRVKGPKLTRACTAGFPARIRVEFST
jgi:ankyrin repeat protein